MTLLFLQIMLLLSQPPVSCDDMDALRLEFHTIESSSQLDIFVSKARECDCPAISPYLGSAIMRKAEYAVSPWKKYGYFKEGQAILEDYIKANPKSVEARYVRLLVQSSIPTFLAYNSDIEADEKMIRQGLSASGLSASYQRIILNNVNNIVNKQS